MVFSEEVKTNVMLCAICYHLYHLKKVKNTPEAVLLLTLFHGRFSRFLNCTNGAKSRKASQINSCKLYSQAKFGDDLSSIISIVDFGYVFSYLTL